MRSASELNLPTIRALRGVPLRDLAELYSNGNHALWNPDLCDGPPPAWSTASRLYGVKARALIVLCKSHRGLGCLRAR